VSDQNRIPWPDDDALASEPELTLAAKNELAEALRAAWDPAPIDAQRHAELLEQALIDPFAPASEEEARESERLRQALDAGDESHPDVRLLRALSAARDPSPLAPDARERARRSVAKSASPSKSNVVFVTFGAAALAAAAIFALYIGAGMNAARPPSAERLAPSRSTAELFEGEFEQGETTERIDRIASARAHDLRENRYLMWGAR
jgi:hypothetical protein